MIDPGSLVTSAGILLAGFLAGRIRRRKAPPARDPAFCPCGHPYSMRDPETGFCTGHNSKDVWTGQFDKRKDKNPIYASQLVPCDCRDHTSPEHAVRHWPLPPPEQSGD